MTTEPTEEPLPAHRSRLAVIAAPAAALGIVALLALLAVLRRDPTLLESIYIRGNLLETHSGSDLSLSGFQLAVAHLELLLLAALVTLCGVGLRHRMRATLLAFGASFAVIYADSITRYSATVANRLYVFVCDDALISMRYARNFAEGRGLVYNVGEAVDGYTNPLWTALMVLPHAARLPEGIATIPVLMASGALLVATALLVRALLASFEVPAPLQWLAALAIVYDASNFEYAVAGLESPLVGFGITLFVWAYFRQRPRVLAAALVILTLTRADGMAVALVMLGWMVLDRSFESGRGIIATMLASVRPIAIVLGVGIALMVWRYAIYGHPLPNTYYLKVYPLAKRLTGGIASYGVRGLVMYGLPAAYVLVNGGTNERTRTARRLLIAVGVVWLYSMYVGGDVFIFMRFVGPVTPLLWMAVAMVAGVDWSQRSRSGRATTFVLMALVIPMKSERGILGATWDRGDWIRQNITAAKTIEHNVPEGATVATFYAGMPYFAPHHRFIDLLGKTESHIAHETQIHGIIPGHNKFDFPYIYNVRKPDVTFSALSCDEIERFEQLPPDVKRARALDVEQNHTIYQAPVAQAADPTFQELYVPNRVVLRDGDAPAGHSLGCWYLREGTNVPLVWQVARE